MGEVSDQVIVGDRGIAHQTGDLERNVARLFRMILVDLWRADHLGAAIEREAVLAENRFRLRQLAAGVGVDETLAAQGAARPAPGSGLVTAGAAG